jgi:hypothetical protein
LTIEKEEENTLGTKDLQGGVAGFWYGGDRGKRRWGRKEKGDGEKTIIPFSFF